MKTHLLAGDIHRNSLIFADVQLYGAVSHCIFPIVFSPYFKKVRKRTLSTPIITPIPFFVPKT